MNKQISILMILVISMISFTACTDEDNLRFTAPEEVEQLTITNDVLPVYFIGEQNSDNIAERFTWETPNFGVESNISYDLEYSLDGTFESPSVLASTSARQAAVTIEQIFNVATDTTATGLGLDTNPETSFVDENGDPVLDENGEPVPNDSGELFLRVNAQLGTDNADNSPESISETIVMNIQMIEDAGDCDPPIINLFMVGAATAAGWDNDNNNPVMRRDPENPNIHTFTGFFKDDPSDDFDQQFKILDQLGDWDSQWGVSPSGNLISKDELGQDPDVFEVPDGEGYYTFQIDLCEMTFSFESFDESSADNFSSIGVIGSATTGDDSGWNQDIDLTQSSFDSHLWFINGINLFDGEAKLRAEDEWTTNWGGNELISFGSQDGPNIPIEPGTYDILFNDIDGTYAFLLQDD